MSRMFHFVGLGLLVSCVLMIVAYPILVGIEGISFGTKLVGTRFSVTLAILALLALVALGISRRLDAVASNASRKNSSRSPIDRS